MALFRKRSTEDAATSAPAPAAAPPTIAESVGWLVQHASRPSLTGYTDFVKQVDCVVCGATKRLPSRTAYLYCDHCGALIDYDFRAANLGTNAGITNTVFHALVAPQQAALNAGALACTISGAGPTLFALAPNQAKARRCAAAMVRAFGAVGATAHVGRIGKGARVLGRRT